MELAYFSMKDALEVAQDEAAWGAWYNNMCDAVIG